jgi:hypothetical protein
MALADQSWCIVRRSAHRFLFLSKSRPGELPIGNLAGEETDPYLPEIRRFVQIHCLTVRNTG